MERPCWTSSCWPWDSASSPYRLPTHSAAIASEESPMLVEYILGGLVTVALLIYLTYALLRPERF